ncbi:hypothetical protein PROFUN_02884 [Planoprotostelium fungivorum]|uniref:Uncharacterized protein n=1 Tax=Planoprotostelium fungivorum TaxID=1890364 RepID=A0A2P6NS01_9EUKA|nr:hypothetical protein PROFUN_02884 [Planoprotostelium fungivorum]
MFRSLIFPLLCIVAACEGANLFGLLYEDNNCSSLNSIMVWAFGCTSLGHTSGSVLVQVVQSNHSVTYYDQTNDCSGQVSPVANIRWNGLKSTCVPQPEDSRKRPFILTTNQDPYNDIKSSVSNATFDLQFPINNCSGIPSQVYVSWKDEVCNPKATCRAQQDDPRVNRLYACGRNSLVVLPVTPRPSTAAPVVFSLFLVTLAFLVL